MKTQTHTINKGGRMTNTTTHEKKKQFFENYNFAQSIAQNSERVGITQRTGGLWIKEKQKATTEHRKRLELLLKALEKQMNEPQTTGEIIALSTEYQRISQYLAMAVN